MHAGEEQLLAGAPGDGEEELCAADVAVNEDDEGDDSVAVDGEEEARAARRTAREEDTSRRSASVCASSRPDAADF